MVNDKDKIQTGNLWNKSLENFCYTDLIF